MEDVWEMEAKEAMDGWMGNVFFDYYLLLATTVLHTDRQTDRFD
jgi:hypothetical protein